MSGLLVVPWDKFCYFWGWDPYQKPALNLAGHPVTAAKAHLPCSPFCHWGPSGETTQHWMGCAAAQQVMETGFSPHWLLPFLQNPFAWVISSVMYCNASIDKSLQNKPQFSDVLILLRTRLKLHSFTYLKYCGHLAACNASFVLNLIWKKALQWNACVS